MSTEMFGDYDFNYDLDYSTKKHIEEPEKLEEKIKSRIFHILKSDLIILNSINISNEKSGRQYYVEENEFDKLSNLNKLLFLEREKDKDTRKIVNNLFSTTTKNKEEYDTSIVSKNDYFLIKNRYEVIKVNKTDILKVQFSDKRIIFKLKNNEEVITDLSGWLSNYKISDKYVTLNFQYNSKKIIDFFYEEIENFIDRKTLVSVL